MPEKKKINMSIIEGDSFFSHETSINFSPTQFIFDFRNITPRIDPRSPEATLVLKHNVVMLEPYHAKQFLSLLSNVIKKYESDFGKIDRPESLKKLQKKIKNQKSAEDPAEKQFKSQSYFG